MGEVSIDVEARDAEGKSANRRLRAQGRAPAVVYAKGKDPITLSVQSTQLERKLRDSETGMNTLFDLEGDARVSGRTVIVKELQRDPIHGGVIHADFYEIDMSQRLNVSVPIHLLGEAAGVSMG
ncbi:MAG: 50S ribosomal protein L25, partial [Myxococcota bacterium]